MGLIIDFFAGGGGASVGIEMALGREIDIAINHDPEAIRMHKVNHPNTLHLTEDIFAVDLQKYVKDETVDLLWASPDCTSHSKAKGGQPRKQGDFLFATKYDKADLERYDVVLFDFPDNERLCFVKRIIGLPGDTIEIKNGKVYANGTLCCDDFTAELSCDDGVYQVPKGCYFMMGDNRNHSHDSRFWKHPFVKQSQIRGKVKYVLFPFSNTRAIS